MGKEMKYIVSNNKKEAMEIFKELKDLFQCESCEGKGIVNCCFGEYEQCDMCAGTGIKADS